MYALAASAAGVGVLALAHTAQAKIVYTPAHTKIGQSLKIDLNHDGIADFNLRFLVWGHLGWGAISSLHSNRMWGTPDVSELPAGYRVGANASKFQAGHTWLSTAGPGKSLFICSANSATGTCVGPWTKENHGYVGLRFQIKGKTHYGWARLRYDELEPFSEWVLTGYAYETIPNKPIITGKTHGTDVILRSTTLGALALGRK
jgi:hypothetical protein